MTLLCIESETKTVTNSESVEDVEETVALIKEKLGDELDFIELDEAWDAIFKQIFFDMLIQDLKKCEVKI